MVGVSEIAASRDSVHYGIDRILPHYCFDYHDSISAKDIFQHEIPLSIFLHGYSIRIWYFLLYVLPAFYIMNSTSSAKAVAYYVLWIFFEYLCVMAIFWSD